MLHPARTKLLVVALTAVLILVTALPAQAVAEQPHASSAWSWLDSWLTSTWNRVLAIGSASADDESVPSLDSNGSDESDPAVQATDSESGSEAVPSLDPDG